MCQVLWLVLGIQRKAKKASMISRKSDPNGNPTKGSISIPSIHLFPHSYRGAEQISQNGTSHCATYVLLCLWDLPSLLYWCLEFFVCPIYSVFSLQHHGPETRKRSIFMTEGLQLCWTIITNLIFGCLGVTKQWTEYEMNCKDSLWSYRQFNKYSVSNMTREELSKLGNNSDHYLGMWNWGGGGRNSAMLI